MEGERERWRGGNGGGGRRQREECGAGIAQWLERRTRD